MLSRKHSNLTLVVFLNKNNISNDFVIAWFVMGLFALVPFVILYRKGVVACMVGYTISEEQPLK